MCFLCSVFHSLVTADTFLVEGNKQELQLSNLKPSTTYSVALYATKGPLTSGTVITNLQTRMYLFDSARTVGSMLTQRLALPSAGRSSRPEFSLLCLCGCPGDIQFYL